MQLRSVAATRYNVAAIWRGPAELPTDGSFGLANHDVARNFQVAPPPP